MTEAIAKAIPQPIQRTRQLTVDELKSLQFQFNIQGDNIIIDKGLRGCKLRIPVTLSLNKVLAAKELGLIHYILTSLVSERASLLPLMFDNQSLLKLARHFLRHCSGSYRSCCTYTANIKKYCDWLGYNPDLIINDVKPHGAIPDPQEVQKHNAFLDDYHAYLQDRDLKPGAVSNCIKAIKTFYRVNGVKVELSEPISRRVTYKDRAPKPEELAHLLDIAPALQQRVIISSLALGGFREETLSKLQYRHVREDLEKSIVPIHVHVEAEITKGKYHDYDTFLGAEAANYLKQYIEIRKQGSVDTRRRPPETLTDTSPLIRDDRTYQPRPITSKQIRKIVHDLYLQAGLIKQKSEWGLYNLRGHSLRKYFKTQLTALNVPTDYVEYMMGHTINTYNDIQSLGIDRLRNAYAAAGLAIRQKTKANMIETLKNIIQAAGENPEAYLAREALIQGNITLKTVDEYENHQLQLLRTQLKQLIHEAASV